MAKARKAAASKPPVEPPQDDAVVDFSDALDADSLSPHLERLQAELGIDSEGEYRVHVSKITPEGKDARVWDGPPDDYDLMQTARQYGGSGDYRVKLYGPHESGRTVIRANQIMTVLLAPEEDLALVERRNPKPANNGAAFDPTALAAMITQTMAAALAPVVQALQRPERNPLDDLKGLAEVVKAITPAQAPAVAAGSDFLTTLKNFQALKELTAPAAAADPDNPSGYALNKGIDLVAQMLARHGENRNPAQVPALSAPPESSQISQEDEEVQLKAKLLAFKVRGINAKANAKANAREEAETVYDDLPEDVLQMLAVEPQWFEFICQLVPECIANKEWFDLLRLRIIEIGVEEGVIDAKTVVNFPLTAANQSGTTAGTTPKTGDTVGDSALISTTGNAAG